jgi:predicted nucleic acid-binding protein
MIAADTSSLIAFLKDDTARDVDILGAALLGNDLALPPLVVTEILSDPLGGPAIEEHIRELPVLDLDQNYWARAGHSRAVLLRHGLKAKLADALIAQACIDHDVPLITRDRDFRHFVQYCGLKLA